MPYSKVLPEFSNLHEQKSRERVWEWILKVCDNGASIVLLDQAEFPDMGSLSRDPA